MRPPPTRTPLHKQTRAYRRDVAWPGDKLVRLMVLAGSGIAARRVCTGRVRNPKQGEGDAAGGCSKNQWSQRVQHPLVVPLYAAQRERATHLSVFFSAKIKQIVRCDLHKENCCRENFATLQNQNCTVISNGPYTLILTESGQHVIRETYIPFIIRTTSRWLHSVTLSPSTWGKNAAVTKLQHPFKFYYSFQSKQQKKHEASNARKFPDR